MVVEIEKSAEQDLIEIYWFYEDQEKEAGSYFITMIKAEIMGLAISGGVHRIRHGFHFYPSSRFPHGIYYQVAGDVVKVYAILDCRRNPRWIRNRLKAR